MKFIREHFVAIVLSVLVHGALVVLLVYGYLNFRDTAKPTPPPQLAIEAEVVDEQLITQEMRRIEEEEARRLREEQERAEQLKREREAEEQKLEDARRLRAEEEEAQRLLAEQRQKEEAERAAEKKRKAEQEAKAAAEKKRKDAEARRKAEQEAKLKAEREAQLKRQLAEEERRQQAVDAGLLQQYLGEIQARIQRAWIRPPTAKAGLRCVVYVTQVPGGEVTSARVGDCNGDEIVRQSIEAAVYRASPLPKPSDPALFDRNLELIFAPRE